MTRVVVANGVIEYGHGRTSHLAVADVSFEIPSGSVLGLVGESGSGKTSLGRAVAGLQPLSSGSVTMSVGDGGRPASVQMIFQDPYASLNPRMSVGESIREVLAAHAPRRTRIGRDQVVAALDEMHLPADTANKRPAQLSGGMRQRVAIARVLASRPDVLVADEITASLDASVQGAILNTVREAIRERAITTLFITHNLAIVRYLCDDIAVLRRGTLVESGSARQVIAAPQHAYTRSLIDAMPRLSPSMEEGPDATA